MKEKTSSLKKGSCILTEKPFVYALQAKYRKERCDHCLKLTKLMKCSACGYVYYCNRECQTESWKEHKVECKYLKNVTEKSLIVSDAARMLTRIILKLENGGGSEKGFYSQSGYRKFHDLMTHYDEIILDKHRIEHFQILTKVLGDILGTHRLPNEKELLEFYGRLIINSFNILDKEMNSIATGMYLAASITNHSCSPNAVVTFEGTTLKMRITEDMPCLDWSKIFITYIDLIDTKNERRKNLNDQYYFHCDCIKCSDPNDPTDFDGSVCPNKSCDAFLNINTAECQKCNTTLTKEFRDNFFDVIELTKEHLNKMNETAYLDVCEHCLKKQFNCLHPLHVLHIKTLDNAFEASIGISKYDDALKYAPKLINGYKKYCGEYKSPILAIFHMKVGKIAMWQDNLTVAKYNFHEARKILEITHGRDSSLFIEELLPMILNCEIC